MIETIRNEVIISIKEKLNGYEITGKRIFIKCVASSSYPKGKFYNGTVRFVNTNFVEIMDDVEGYVKVYFVSIRSPDDIADSKKGAMSVDGKHTRY